MTEVLLETIRVRADGRVPLWRWHAARLAQSCAALGLPWPERLGPAQASTDAAVRALVGADAPADRVVRLEVSVDGVTWTARAPGSTAPLRLGRAAVPHPGYPHKRAARAVFEQAREALPPDTDDAWFVSPAGLVAEAAIWMLGWWTPEGLAVPPLADGVLPSVARARLAAIVPVQEVRLPAEALAQQAVLAANAARGVVPVASVDGRPLLADPRTAVVAAAFWPDGGGA